MPTGFIPIEDQGYLLAAVQLPDGAALDRTQHVLDEVTRIAGKTPGVDQVVSIAGISALDNSSSLANAGVAYLILKDWGARGPGEDLRSLVYGLNDKLAVIPEARILVIPPPPIQGIGNAAGFAMVTSQPPDRTSTAIACAKQYFLMVSRKIRWLIRTTRSFSLHRGFCSN